MTNPQNTEHDLLDDSRFIDWVTEPNAELDRYWSEWIGTNAQRRHKVAEARALLEGLEFPSQANTSPIDQTMLWTKINEEIDANTQTRTLPRRRWWWVAASIALLLALGLGIDWTPNSFSVPYGAMERIELPDGSQVVLNANSYLRFEPGWKAQKDREVWLEGEAFFEVNPQPKKGNRRFVVHTNHGDIKVLGTSFNVKDRTSEFSVVLTEGSVLLSLPQRTETEVKMEPGEFVQWNLVDDTIDKTTINTDLYTAWTQGKLVFDNTSIAYLATVIEEQYGYEVEIADEALLERRLTGTLHNPSLDDLIRAITAAFDIQVKKTGKGRLTIAY